MYTRVPFFSSVTPADLDDPLSARMHCGMFANRAAFKLLQERGRSVQVIHVIPSKVAFRGFVNRRRRNVGSHRAVISSASKDFNSTSFVQLNWDKLKQLD